MKKLHGFENEYLFVLPSTILNNFNFSEVIKLLYITDLGFYPKARYHFAHRNHGAKEWILIFCTHGKGTVKSATEEWQIENGSIVLLPPNEEHTYYANDDDPWDIFWVHFTGNSIDEYIPQEALQKNGFLIIDKTSTEDMQMLMSQFWQMIQALSAGFSYQSVFYSSQVLGATLAYVSLQSFLPHDAYTMGNEYITKAVKYIYDHFEEKVSLSTLTEVLDVSKSYLSRIFRRTVGTSVNRFILDIKMKQACYYLKDTNLAVHQIATRLGYDDPYYFSRIFKKVMGSSPRIFRNQEKNIL